VKIGTAKAVLYLSGLYENFPVHSALLALNWLKFSRAHVHKNLFCNCEFFILNVGPLKATIHLEVYICSYFTHFLPDLGEFRYKGSENNAVDDL
jgi:hypothetical protein